LEPVFDVSDLVNLENRNAYVKMLINGQPGDPFNIETLSPQKGNLELIEKIKELSRLKYGRDRKEIEEEIMKKYKQVN